jgi:hypothetical protein
VPIDRERLDLRDAALMLGRSLAQALAELPKLEATHLATTWALSEDPLRRAAVAAPRRLSGVIASFACGAAQCRAK